MLGFSVCRPRLLADGLHGRIRRLRNLGPVSHILLHCFDEFAVRLRFGGDVAGASDDKDVSVTIREHEIPSTFEKWNSAVAHTIARPQILNLGRISFYGVHHSKACTDR